MNQVATKKKALATFDAEVDANKGAQNISQEDLALPFLKILGQLSPEVNKEMVNTSMAQSQVKS